MKQLTIIEQANKLIDSEFKNLKTGVLLAGKLGITESSLYSAFRDYGLPSPLVTLKEKRMKAIHHEITQTSRPFKDIAKEFGYHTTALLGGAFSNYYGVAIKVTRLNSSLDTNVKKISEIDIPELLMEYINDLGFKQISRVALEKQYLINYSYLNILFKQRYGKTIKRHQLDLFLDYAEKETINNGISFEELCEKCQFLTRHGLTLNFKRRFGGTHREFAMKNTLGVRIKKGKHFMWLTKSFGDSVIDHMFELILEHKLNLVELRKFYNLSVNGWSLLFESLFNATSLEVSHCLRATALIYLIQNSKETIPFNINRMYPINKLPSLSSFKRLTGTTPQLLMSVSEPKYIFNLETYLEVVERNKEILF